MWRAKQIEYLVRNYSTVARRERKNASGRLLVEWRIRKLHYTLTGEQSNQDQVCLVKILENVFVYTMGYEYHGPRKH